jgi:hypothetical protein
MLDNENILGSIIEVAYCTDQETEDDFISKLKYREEEINKALKPKISASQYKSLVLLPPIPSVGKRRTFEDIYSSTWKTPIRRKKLIDYAKL